MDTLQVTNQSTSQQSGGSKHSSRAPSPSRYAEQLSRDRESADNTGGGVVNSSSRYRNQSPSTTHRKSRERERLDKDQSIISEQSTLNAADMTADHTDIFDESRGSANEDMLVYPSFNADEADFINTGDQESRQHTPGNRHQRTNSLQAIDRLTTKIACTRELIRKEQTARDDNVNEYLKLAASADKQQLHRIKAVFEKKNQKSAHNIAQLQKKLESYTKRYKDLQMNYNVKLQMSQQRDHRQPREMLRDVGQGLRNVGGNIRDGVTTGVATVMSKPREFAHLIKNKFGSADNINQLSSNPDMQEMNLNASASSAANDALNQTGQSNTLGTGTGSSGKFNSEHDSECSSVTSDSNPGGLFLKCNKNTGSGSGGGRDSATAAAQQFPSCIKTILAELQERKEDLDKLKERFERLETTQKELSDLSLLLESERYRAERLEEQVNDLTELHQNEIENLKQAMADMEEKVQYQSDERLRDVNEVLENCQTRISKMEHMSQQQYVTVDGIDNSNARALVVKLINVVLTVLQVILLLTATAAGILMPFLKTRVRVLTTFLFVLVFIFVIRTWPEVWPDVREIGSHVVKRLKETLIAK